MSTYKEEMLMYFELTGISDSTKESYYRRISSFIEFFRERFIKPEDITIKDIQKYILFLKNQKGLSAGSINNYLSSIKYFWIHSLGKEWDKSRLPRMKIVQKMPVLPAREEIFMLLNSVDNLKHKAILHLLFGGGLRVGEVAKLKIGDIDSKSMRIRIDDAKHGTDRYTILSKTALSVLREYFKKYFKVNQYEKDNWLFYGQNTKNHINVKSIKNTIIKLRKKLDLDTRISANTLRHAFAVYMLEDKVDAVIIQQLLGHKHLTTTSRYYLYMTSKSFMGIESPLDSYLEGEYNND